MSLRSITPCDFQPYVCPYDAEGHADCEYWCGACEPDDLSIDWEDDTPDIESIVEDEYENRI